MLFVAFYWYIPLVVLSEFTCEAQKKDSASWYFVQMKISSHVG